MLHTQREVANNNPLLAPCDSVRVLRQLFFLGNTEFIDWGESSQLFLRKISQTFLFAHNSPVSRIVLGSTSVLPIFLP